MERQRRAIRGPRVHGPARTPDYAAAPSALRSLHYLDEPARALHEAARVLKVGGRLLIADFAPHELEPLRDEHAHRRLGIAHQAMTTWLDRAGLELLQHESLEPRGANHDRGLTVSLWLARKR